MACLSFRSLIVALSQSTPRHIDFYISTLSLLMQYYLKRRTLVFPRFQDTFGGKWILSTYNMKLRVILRVFMLLKFGDPYRKINLGQVCERMIIIEMV